MCGGVAAAEVKLFISWAVGANQALNSTDTHTGHFRSDVVYNIMLLKFTAL